MPIPNVTLTGNATADAELRFTQNGLAVANFNIAVNDRKFNRQTNEWEEGEATFLQVTAWRDLGEHVAATVRKGMRVVVTGKVNLREYERNDGTKGSSLDMDAQDVSMSLLFAVAQVQKAQSSGTQAQNRQAAPAAYGQAPQGYGQPQAPQGPPPGAWQQPQQPQAPAPQGPPPQQTQQPGWGGPAQQGWPAQQAAPQPGNGGGLYGDDTPF
jgi:single-strand DNA-binding protein